MTLAMLGGTLVAPLTRAQRHGTLRAIQYTPCRGLMVGTAVVGVEVIRLVQQAIRSAAGVLAHDVQQPVCHWWVEQAGLRGHSSETIARAQRSSCGTGADGVATCLRM